LSDVFSFGEEKQFNRFGGREQVPRPLKFVDLTAFLKLLGPLVSSTHHPMHAKLQTFSSNAQVHVCMEWKL
jgi:hypothetical protein